MADGRFEAGLLCIELDLIEGNILFADGAKFYANGATKKTHKKEYYEKKLNKTDERIEKILEECEDIDKKGGNID